jgi:hypothetical protein
MENSKKNVSELAILMSQMFELRVHLDHFFFLQRRYLLYFVQILEHSMKLEERETIVTVDSKKFKQVFYCTSKCYAFDDSKYIFS